MTKAKEALNAFNVLIQTLDHLDNGDNRFITGFNKAFKIAFTVRGDVRRALRILDKIESGQLHKPTVGEECQLIRALSYNQCLDDLRGIE